MITDNQGNPGESQGKRPLYILRRIVIIVVIIVIGIVVARYLVKTKPRVSKRPAERTAPLVTAVSLQPQSQTVRITAMGTVIPSREIVLKTPVGGEVISLGENFTPGGILHEGAALLQIDPRDYELALQQKERTLSDAVYASRLEQGRQDVALREWDLLYGEKNGGKETESGLALRKPHLEKVQADIKAAKADLELAKLNLSRTGVAAPFNGLVLNKYVDKGAFVAPQEKLADLVGTDEYWVQVSLPPDRLQWLKIPNANNATGSPVKVLYRQETREGQVIRLLGDLTKEGRMARLLVSVPDPLGLSSKDRDIEPLILGEYVRVEIEGEELHEVFRIPRPALRNDREIWLVDGKGKLAIRPVDIIWRDERQVLVRDGLQSGDLLIVSNLAVPVDGMAVRVDQGAGLELEAVLPQAEGIR